MEDLKQKIELLLQLKCMSQRQAERMLHIASGSFSNYKKGHPSLTNLIKISQLGLVVVIRKGKMEISFDPSMVP